MSDDRRAKGRSDPQEKPSLSERLSLRPAEAAAALGVSKRTFRQLLPRLPHVREGNVVLVPVDTLRAWLGERARAQVNATDAAVSEILEAIVRDD
jgi:excisionase family DNA binding protein